MSHSHIKEDVGDHNKPPKAKVKPYYTLLGCMDGKNNILKRLKKRKKMAEEGSARQTDWKSMKRTMKIVRSGGAYLYNNNDEKFLDCVSGASHVGHCYPSIINAAQQPLARWGSGTVLHMSQYLAQEIEPVAEIENCNFDSKFCNRILSSLNIPDKLNSALVFNSGSHANDVALQIARSVTGGFDVVVFEESFHGCLSSGNELSAKLFGDRNTSQCFGSSSGDGSSRSNGDQLKKSSWVHILPVPDLEGDGVPEGGEEEALENYFLKAKNVIDEATLNGAKIACIISEPIFTFHSVLVPDSSYFRRICIYVKSLGGLVIMDEVQTGLCRTGHRWGFEIHKVTPDIVTTGKALASGHPMSMLATAKEYVRTLGPYDALMYRISPLQEALGNALLDVIEKEDLLQHSAQLGSFIKDYVQDLMKSRRRLGGIRGEGLLLGIQFVNLDKNPDPALAEKVLYSLRARHIVSSIEGKYGNVLFLAPPLCFTKQNALTVLKNIDEVLIGLEKSDSTNYPVKIPFCQGSSLGCITSHFSEPSLHAEIVDEGTDNTSLITNISGTSSSSYTTASTSSSSHGEGNSYEAMD